jgi:ADP-ribose pyrophosphatase YjhB (NUDIX family)
MKYRIAAKGVLERNNKILLIEYSDSSGIYYSLPGGKHELGESLSDTVVREFKEETSYDVVTGRIVMVREFIVAKPDVESWKGGIHQIETIFTCNLVNENQEEGIPTISDADMLGIKWIDKNDLINYRVYPTNELAEILQRKNITYIFTNN